MNSRILFVDDEPQLLDAIRRTLHRQFELKTATSAAEGLQLLKDSAPFALVISDMRMPAMNGAQFLAKVRDEHPDTVRMILSGQSDLSATIAAVNEGHIYRFLTKPCANDDLVRAINDGIKQHQLITAERVLLKETLVGSIRMLVEMLGMVSPVASNRAGRLQRYMAGMSTTLKLPDHWQIGLAALVSQIGCVAMPTDIIAKVESGQALESDELALYQSHPDVASKLLAPISRLEEVARIVRAQFSPLNFAGKPPNIAQWDTQSIGELLLRTAVEFDRLILAGSSATAAASALRSSPMQLPSSIVQALQNIQPLHPGSITRKIKVKDLVAGMILDEDLVSPKGIRLIPAGQEVTCSLIVRLKSIADGVGVVEPFKVRSSA